MQKHHLTDIFFDLSLFKTALHDTVTIRKLWKMWRMKTWKLRIFHQQMLKTVDFINESLTGTFGKWNHANTRKRWNGTLFDAFKTRLIDSWGAGTFLWHQILGEIATNSSPSNFLLFCVGYTLAKHFLPSHVLPFSKCAGVMRLCMGMHLCMGGAHRRFRNQQCVYPW